MVTRSRTRGSRKSYTIYDASGKYWKHMTLNPSEATHYRKMFAEIKQDKSFKNNVRPKIIESKHHKKRESYDIFDF
jgi:hypothetical protein